MGYFYNNYNELRYPSSNGDVKGLRRAQIGAIHAIAAHYTLRNDPAIVVMPTGAGKTAVLMMAAYVLMAERVLIITPSRLVRNQIAEDFRELSVLKKINVFGTNVKGPNVFEVQSTINSSDMWEQLSEFDVVVSTPNSISPALENIVVPPDGFFDLILVDEAHHSPAATWEAILNCFQNAKKVLFTATPFRQDRKEIKGKFVYVYNLSDAYKDGVYGDINFIPVKSSDPLNNDIEIARQTENVFFADKESGFEHFVMVRTESKKRAKELQKIYSENTKLNLKLVNSDCSYSSIKKTIEKLKSKELDGVICVDMLGEGFDFPNLKIAAIHVPHRSLAITLQFIGRFARTNADKIGTAKFLAVPSEIQIETTELYKEGAVWQKIITNLSESKIEEETDTREKIEMFSEPEIFDSEAEDLSLYSLAPYNHVKIFRASECNFDNEIDLLPGMSIVFRQKSEKLGAIVFITREKQKPLWTNMNKFEKIVYDLFVGYFDSRAGLIFICASKKSDVLYEKIAWSFMNKKPKKLPLSVLNKVLIGLKNPEFFNVGLRNRSVGNNTESYRIIAGGNAHKAVKESDGRLYHSGHLFGKGMRQDGNLCTIGFSSSSKVWSNTSSQIPKLISWCKEIAQKTLSHEEVITNSALDYLSVGEEAVSIPINVIAARFNDDAYLASIQLEYTDINSSKVRCALLDIDINVDVENSDSSKIILYFKHNDYCLPAEFRIDSDKFFRPIGSTGKIDLIRISAFGEQRISFWDYINAKNLYFYFADGSMLDGVNLFRKKPSPYNYFNKSQFHVFDWDGRGIDIECECGTAKFRKISIQAGLANYFIQQNYDLVFYDHGSGEIADFIAIRNGPVIKYEFYHCKGSSEPLPGCRVSDIYEVSGQAQKSVYWIERDKELFDTILRRKDREIKEQGITNRFIVGNETILKEILEANKFKLKSYEIVIVQPGLKNDQINEKIQEVLISTNDHLIGATCEKLRVMCS